MTSPRRYGSQHCWLPLLGTALAVAVILGFLNKGAVQWALSFW